MYCVYKFIYFYALCFMSFMKQLKMIIISEVVQLMLHEYYNVHV